MGYIWKLKTFYKFFIFILLFPSTTFADQTPCNCDQYEALKPLYSLSADASIIGTEALTQGQFPFVHERELQEFTALRLKMQGLIPNECIKKWKDQSRFKFTLQGSLTNKNETEKHMFRGATDKMITAYFQRPTSGCVDQKTKTISKARKCKIENHASFAGMSSLHHYSKSEIATMNRFLQVIGDPTFDRSRESLRAFRNLPVKEKIALLQSIGSRYSLNTNAQADDEKNDRVILPHELYDTAKNNFFEMSTGGTPLRKGKCVEVASSLLYFARDLNFKNVVVLTYKPQVGGRQTHSVLALTDPTTNKVYLINYADSETISPSRGLSTNQSLGDFGIAFDLSAPSSGGSKTANQPFYSKGFVTNATTDFLNMASGIDLSHVGHPFGFQSNQDFVDVKLKITDKIQTGFGLGNSASGDTFFYVPLMASLPPVDMKILRLGETKFSSVPFFQQNSEDEYAYSFVNNYQSRQLMGVFSQIELELKSPEIKLTKEMKAEIFSRANTMLLVGKPVGQPARGQGEGIDSSFFYTLTPGIRTSMGNPAQDRFTAQARVEGQLFPGTTDIRDHSSNWTPFAFDHLLGSVDTRYKFCKNPKEDLEKCAIFLATMSVIVDQFGVSGKAEAGVVTPRFGHSVAIQGALESDSARFKDYSNRSVSYQARGKVFEDALRVFLGFQGTLYPESNEARATTNLTIEN